MAQAFDPYHVWLGIPPSEQPPNCYRLLGIALFESNADVVATAADRQMGHLRTYQSGKHSELSQRLLNEVARAKVCLLTPAKKAAYDAQLRQQLQPSPPGDAAPAAVDATSWADITGARSSSVSHRVARKRPASPGPIIAVAVAGALLLAGFIAWNATPRANEAGEQAALTPKRSDQPVPQQTANRPETTARRPEPPVLPLIVKTDSVPTQVKTIMPVAPKEPAEPAAAKAELTSVTRPFFEEPTEKPTDAVEKPVMPSFEAPADAPTKPANEPTTTKRLPVPDDGKQEKIAAQIAGVFDSSRAKTPKERVKLAYQLLQAAKASKEPNERYVLLHQGRELAGQGGDVALVLQAVEMTAAAFDINLLEEQEKSLLALAGKAIVAEQIRSVCGASQRVIAQALLEGRYQSAADLANAVFRACQRAQGKEFRKKALDQRAWVLDYCRRQDERREAEAKLKTNPHDAESHLALGRYYSFADDWKNGVPHLAEGSDAELRQLAQRDLTSPNEAAEQTALADAWWDLGKARNGEERDVLLLRAGTWYDLAHGKLSSGLERLKAEKRLEELVEVRQRHAASQRLHSGKDSAKDLWNDMF